MVHWQKEGILVTTMVCWQQGWHTENKTGSKELVPQSKARFQKLLLS